MNKYLYIIPGIFVLFLSLGVSAATYTPTLSVSPTTARAQLDNEYIVPWVDSNGQASPLGNDNILVYTFTVSPTLQFGVDGYTSGSGIFEINFTTSDPSGWQFFSIEKEYDGIYTDNLAVTTYTKSNDTTKRIQLRLYASNCFYEGWTGLGDVTIHLLYTQPVSTSPGTNDPDPYITVTSSIQYSTTPSFTLTTSPQSLGIVNEIATAIDQTEIGQDIAGMAAEVAAVYNVLDAFKTQENSNYINLLSALNTSNNWSELIEAAIDDCFEYIQYLYAEIQTLNSTTDAIYNNEVTIKSYLNSIKSYTNSLKTYMSTFPQYSAQVLEYLGKLATMNAEQASEAAEMASQYAQIGDSANSMSSNMSPPRPVISASQFDIENSVDSVQLSTFGGLVGMILANSFITKMLVIVFTGALIGFVLYGRKK